MMPAFTVKHEKERKKKDKFIYEHNYILTINMHLKHLPKMEIRGL